MLELDGLKYRPEKRDLSGKRGAIEDFSKKSRFRFMRLMATIDGEAAGLPDFVALTYPDEWSRDWRVWKRDRDAFTKALVRKWPNVWGPWRLEFQQRGAPHFHLLLWDGPGVEGMKRYDRRIRKMSWLPVPGTKSAKNKEIFEWISATWYRIVASGDEKHLKAGTRIEPIETWGGVIYYISKYLAKLQEGNFVPVDYTGRFWGVIQKDRWKVRMLEEQVPEAAWYRMRRVLEKRRIALGGRKRKLEERTCLSTFIDFKEGARLLRWALESLDDSSRRAPF